ncbi:hypothetical protein EHS25_006671 [Saitozyma podzolica]|uniref:Uncharacterized protein n=1 Tax=Saitozyma podzolica TaxID=1890683 RepID=A0A427YSA1_9TREE|nr:hypothetical protein EHS25_006671 [Saitozyma podzolica]
MDVGLGNSSEKTLSAGDEEMGAATPRTEPIKARGERRDLTEEECEAKREALRALANWTPDLGSFGILFQGRPGWENVKVPDNALDDPHVKAILDVRSKTSTDRHRSPPSQGLELQRRTNAVDSGEEDEFTDAWVTDSEEEEESAGDEAGQTTTTMAGGTDKATREARSKVTDPKLDDSVPTPLHATSSMSNEAGPQRALDKTGAKHTPRGHHRPGRNSRKRKA